MWVAALGAIIGDFIGYIIGKRYGNGFMTKYCKYVFIKQEFIEKTKKLVKDHAGKALIIGRTNPITRALAPFIAGASDVKFMKFFVFNIIGGIIWAVGCVILGYLFGESYELVSKYLGKVVIGLIIFIIALIWLYRFIKKRILWSRNSHRNL